MRWFINTFLIAVSLISLYFIAQGGEISYSQLTGFVFFRPTDVPALCDQTTMTFLWADLFYESAPSGSSYFIAGTNCVDAVLFKNSYSAPVQTLWYLELDNQTTVTVTAGVYKLTDSSGTLFTPPPTTKDALITIINANTQARDPQFSVTSEASTEADADFVFNTEATSFTIDTAEYFEYQDTESLLGGYDFTENIKVFKSLDKEEYGLTAVPVTTPIIQFVGLIDQLLNLGIFGKCNNGKIFRLSGIY